MNMICSKWVCQRTIFHIIYDPSELICSERLTFFSYSQNSSDESGSRVHRASYTPEQLAIPVQILHAKKKANRVSKETLTSSVTTNLLIEPTYRTSDGGLNGPNKSNIGPRIAEIQPAI
jgi:hypothetical protein